MPTPSAFAQFLYNYEYLKLNGILREYFTENALTFFTLCAVWVVFSYLIGSVNFAIVLSKLIYRDDIRKYGSGNAGFTNMRRTFGTRAGVLTLLGDFGKTVVGVAVGMILFGVNTATFAGLACVLGHCFPCFYKFKGGKGVAAAGTMAFILDPIVFLILIAIFILIVLSTKYLSLGSIMSLILYPLIHSRIYDWLHSRILPNYFIKNGLYTEVPTLDGAITAIPSQYHTLNHTVTAPMIFVGIFLAVFVVVMHRANIRRMMNGEENRFLIGKKAKEKARLLAESTAEAKKSRHRLDELDEELKD
ncbi:MAG: glycerol-3-phosphate 1-O-acyltransferase PlsY [Clostridia bacterium]|nr:glycerol-3-phosphate 1-O-acyltransferase PlsY [Clostridia bacterium]